MNITWQQPQFLKLVVLCSLMGIGRPAGAGIIFSDEFTTDPATNGWAIDISGAAAGGSTVTSNGNQAVLTEGGGTGAAAFSMTRTIDTTGFSGITLNLIAFQSNVNFENSDYLGIQIDTGSGFSDLLRDYRAWTGTDDAPVGTGQSGTTTATSTGVISLPVAASQNAALGVRIIAEMSTADEVYFLESFEVSGASTVPEPNSLGLAGLITIALGGLQLRKRRHRKIGSV